VSIQRHILPFLVLLALYFRFHQFLLHGRRGTGRCQLRVSLLTNRYPRKGSTGGSPMEFDFRRSNWSWR